MIGPDDFDQVGAPSPTSRARAGIDSKPPAITPGPQISRSAPRWLVLAVALGLIYWWGSRSEQAPPNPATSQVSPPVVQPAQPAGALPADIDAASISSAAVGAPLVVFGTRPQSPYDLFVNVGLSLTARSPARARVIARFYLADGAPMPKINDQFADFAGSAGGQAAVWDWATVEQPPGVELASYVLKIPNTAIAQGDGLFAVVSVEDMALAKSFATLRSGPFSNAW